VFDFTIKMYADKMIKLIDDDSEEIKKVKLSKKEEEGVSNIK